jgi:hypothetical protein
MHLPHVTSRSFWIAIAFASALFGGVPAGGAEDGPCPDLEHIRGLGDVCPRPNGLYEVFSPDGRSLGYTHGLDPPPSEGDGGGASGARPVACVSGAANTYYVRVLYARATNDADGFAAKVPEIRSLVEQANGLLFDSASATGGVADLKVKCVGGLVEVLNAVLPTPMASASFATIVSDLENQGFNDPKVKYWVYYDDTGACTCGGTGHVYDDSKLLVSNLNNGNGDPLFAVNFGYNSARIMMHELGHNMGAVQNGAPHATGALHCWDGLDTMCYNDGGPNGWKYTTTACAVEVWDCHNDDYFHADPAGGSYLALNWNIAHPYNRFLRGCLDTTGSLQAGLGGVAVLGVSAVDVPLPLSCQGSLFHLWNGGPLGTNYDVCWFQGGVQLSCNSGTALSNGGSEVGKVPATATTARVILHTGAQTAFVLKAT